MEKVTGIKSVDFKITAKGHGVVNWNGSTTLAGKGDSEYNNHNMPKLRGYTNIKGYGDKGKLLYKSPNDVDLSKTPLYISHNCIRHHLFREDGFINVWSPEVVGQMDKLLCSLTGLVRGYVVPSNEYKRTSALLLTDFVDQLGNGNFEQMGKSGSKEKIKTKTGGEKSPTMFSKTTFACTKYTGYGSISIEQLQFIPLDDNFSRKAMIINSSPKMVCSLPKKLLNLLIS